MIKRPEYDDFKGENKTIDYIFALNVYVSELEASVKKLRYGIMYAQDVIEADIPSFESLLQQTRFGGQE